MNKKIAKNIGIFLGFALTLGSGVLGSANLRDIAMANAAELSVAKAVFNATNNSDSIGGYTNKWKNNTEGFSWDIVNFNNNNNGWGYVKCGSKSAAITASISTTNTVAETISKVSITMSAVTSSAVNSIKLFGGSDATTELGSFTIAAGTQSVSVPSSYQGANQKYKVQFDCQKASKNGPVSLKEVEIFKEASDVPPTSVVCSDQSISVSESVDLSDKTTFLPDGSITTLSYAVKSGAEYIDLDATSGVVTGKKAGTAIVTITPENTTGGATAIDVTITVNALAASGLTVGEKYILYVVDQANSYKGEFNETNSSNNYIVPSSFDADVPSCVVPLTAKEGYYENTVAFTADGTNYLAYKSGATSNSIYTSTTIDAYSSWVVNWNSETNAATIVNAADKGRSIQFNYNGGTNPRFACYAPGSQTAVSLYHYVEKALTDFTITPTLSVYKTGTKTIEVTYTPADAADKTLTWASDNEAVATVNSEGVVTGVSVGTANISASKVIGESTVTRTCAVTVLNNATSHDGTADDPFTVEEAVNVTNGILTSDSKGNTISLTNSYYVKGLITKTVNRTTTNLTFWIGDNASQVSNTTGAFEVFKAKSVYGTALSTGYTDNAEVVEDFNVGYYVTVYSTFTVYNGTAETKSGVADITWNNYIEARTYAEKFLNTLSTGASAVCKPDGSTTLSDLVSAWGTLSTTYSSLTVEAKALFNAGTENASGSAVEKTLALYKYIGEKYGKQLETEALTNFDFMNRGLTPLSSANDVSVFEGNNRNVIFALIIAANSGIALLCVYLFIRRRKEINN